MNTVVASVDVPQRPGADESKPEQVPRQSSMAKKRKPQVVGGGFAGVAAAKSLRGCDADVTLTDRRNHHIFQPLLYQVATEMSATPEARHDVAGTRYVGGE